MKNILRIAALLSFTVVGLVSCGVESSTPASNPSWVDDSFEELTTEYVQTGCSIGEAILDIDVGIALETNLEYDISINPSNVTSKELTFILSHPDVLQINFNETLKSYSFLGKKQGDCIISVRNINEELIYRNVVKIRNKIAQSDMPSYLLSIDKWVGAGAFGDQFQILFTSSTEGILSGRDQNVNIGQLHFTYEFSEELPLTQEYFYNITSIENGPTSLAPRRIGVYRNGSLMHLLDNNGPIDLFKPVKNS